MAAGGRAACGANQSHADLSAQFQNPMLARTDQAL